MRDESQSCVVGNEIRRLESRRLFLRVGLAKRAISSPEDSIREEPTPSQELTNAWKAGRAEGTPHSITPDTRFLFISDVGFFGMLVQEVDKVFVGKFLKCSHPVASTSASHIAISKLHHGQGFIRGLAASSANISPAGPELVGTEPDRASRSDPHQSGCLPKLRQEFRSSWPISPNDPLTGLYSARSGRRPQTSQRSGLTLQTQLPPKEWATESMHSIAHRGMLNLRFPQHIRQTPA